MLQDKWKHFEELFNVPENEWLPSEGWTQSFCRAYKLKEHQCHGEASSADSSAVDAEQKHLHDLMKKFALWDWWNFDETSLFPKWVVWGHFMDVYWCQTGPPQTKDLQPSIWVGRKRIISGSHLVLHAMLMEVRKCLHFILGGLQSHTASTRSHQMSMAFTIRTIKRLGWLWNFLKSGHILRWLHSIYWSCMACFNRWVKKFDLTMCSECQHILLVIDNFLGHKISYEPTNIQIELFKPNLTAFVQPLDAGIIRCFKAHYCNSFCKYALLLNEAGEQDVYKITLKEAMMIAKDAWEAITPETIQNCWNHTQIQP